MRSRPPPGAASRAIALALAAALSGAPAVVTAAFEREHRCQCPAGSHACSCPRCAARAVAKASSKAPCHGPAGDGAPAAPAPRRAPPDAPCLGAGCHAPGPPGTAATGGDPFVLPQRPAGACPGRGEGFARPALAGAAVPASPEPPPPRA